jgi:hypothetical protein
MKSYNFNCRVCPIVRDVNDRTELFKVKAINYGVKHTILHYDNGCGLQEGVADRKLYHKIQ